MKQRCLLLLSLFLATLTGASAQFTMTAGPVGGPAVPLSNTGGPGAVVTGAFTVCNSTVADNITFSGIGYTPANTTKVNQTFTHTNTTFTAANSTNVPIAGYAGTFDRRVTLVNPAIGGTMVMRFQSWNDDGAGGGTANDGLINGSEGATEKIIEYTVTVNPAPLVSGVSIPANICENSSIPVTINGFNLNQYGIASINYDFIGGGPTNVTTTGPFTVTATSISFNTNPEVSTLATTGIRINSITPIGGFPVPPTTCSIQGVFPFTSNTSTTQQLPTISNVIPSDPTCPGDPVKVRVQGLISGTAFQLLYTVNGAGPVLTSSTNTPVGTSMEITLPTVPYGTVLHVVGIQTVSPIICTRDIFPAIQVTPNINDVQPGAIAADQIICWNTTPDPLTSTTPGTSAAGGTITYLWEVASDNCIGGTFAAAPGANTGLGYAPGALTQDRWYRRRTQSTWDPDGAGPLASIDCFAYSNCVKVTVNNIQNAGALTTGTPIICENGTATINGTLPTSDGDDTYEWESVTSNDLSCPGAGFTTIAGATGVNYTTVALTADTWYRRKTISTLTIGALTKVCTRYSNCVKVWVNNLTPGVVAANQTICTPPTGTGDPAAFTTTTAATADGTISYQWESVTSDDATCPAAGFAAIGGATSENYDAPAGLTADTWYRRRTRSSFDPDGGGPLPSVDCDKYTTCIKVTVNNVNGGAIAADQVICSGDDPADLTSTTAGTGDGTITYRWEQSTTGCAGPWTPLAVTTEGFVTFPVANDIFYRRVTISTLNSVACEAYSNCVSIFVNNVTAGSIQANETICAFGDPANITEATAATGDGTLTYRWESTTVAGCASGWATIPAATGTTYDPPVGIVFTTCYRRVAISTWDPDGAGPLTAKACEAISNNVIKTVESGVAAPTGSSTFTPATTCQTGAGGTIAVTNNMNCPAGTAAVWYTADYPAAPPGAWVGMGNAPTTLPTNASGVQTFYVACKQINPPYCESTSRTPITFEVLPAPNRPNAGAVTITPNQICQGSPTPSVPMTNTGDAACVAANSAGFTAVWYDNMGVMLPPSGAAPTMTPTATTTWQVRCKNPVTGCISLNFRTVTFTVNPAPAAPAVFGADAPNAQFYPKEACQGPAGSTVALDPTDLLTVPNTIPFNIGCTPFVQTLRWYLADGTTLLNGTGNSPTTLPTGVAGLQTYRVACVTNATGCESLTKTTITFMVNPAPAAPTVALTPTTACASTPAGAPMTNNATCSGSTPGGESPVWYDNSGVPLAGAPAVTPAVTTTYQVRCKNTTTNCISLTYTAVTFTVFPTPTIDPIVPATATYCNNASVSALALSGTPATAIAPNSKVWFKYAGGASIGLANGTTSTALPAFTATNAGTVVVNVPITITPYTFGPNGMNDGGTGDDCLGAPFTYTITVIPTPTVTFTCPAPVCANDAFSAIAFTSPVAGTVFNWTNDNTTIGLAGAGMGNIASFTGLNASTTMSNIGVLSVTPSVTVNSVTCTGPVVTCNLVVKPRPTSNLTASQTDVCPNTEVTLNPNCSIPTPTSVVQWGNGAGSAMPAPAGPTVTPTAPDLTYIYTAICVADGCAGNMSEATVRTHRLLVDIVKVAHPGGNVNQPGAIMEVQNDLGKDLSVPKNTIVSNDGMTPRTWNIVARPCYAPVGSISFEFLAGPLPLSYRTVDNVAPHAFFANDNATNFYSQASMTYGPGSMMPFYTGGTPNFPNGVYTVLVQGRTNAVPGAIPAARNKLSGGALLSTRTVTFEVKGTNSGARIGVEEEVVDAENWLSLVQNPISEEIMIRISGNVGDNVQLNLSNLQGQEVHKSNLQLETTSQLNKINARDFNTGFYILKAVNGDKVKTIKVLKVQ